MQQPWNPMGRSPAGRPRDLRVAKRRALPRPSQSPPPARSDAAVAYWEGILEALLLELRLEENRPIPPAQRGVIKQEFCRALQSVWEHGVEAGRRMERREQRRRGRLVEVSRTR